MTDYPVQCFDNNGEPYGRFINPYENQKLADLEWEEFEAFAAANTFPFPSGTIGKTYEGDEVEVVWQYFAELNGISDDWIDCDQRWYDVMNKNSVCPTRTMFCLSQPVEKEPETVDLLRCSCGKEGIKGVDVWQPFAPHRNTVICETCWNKFQDWQRKQEAT